MPRTELVRVYLPLTASLLRRARDEGGFGALPLAAHAVTPAVEEALAGTGQEECEYAAMTAAADESLAVIGTEDAPRRVVAAVDVASWQPRSGDSEAAPSAVEVVAAVPLRRLAAVHVDTEDLPPDPERAAEAAEDQELGWYATQELDDVLAALAASARRRRGTIG